MNVAPFPAFFTYATVIKVSSECTSKQLELFV